MYNIHLSSEEEKKVTVTWSFCVVCFVCLVCMPSPSFLPSLPSPLPPPPTFLPRGAEAPEAGTFRIRGVDNERVREKKKTPASAPLV